MTIFPDSIKMERWDGVAWSDITHHCISDFDIDPLGIMTDAFEDRLAVPGIISFIVYNPDGLFTPEIHFKSKTKLRLTITWLTLSKIFYFYVGEAIPSDTTYGFETISIKAMDWMGLAVYHLLRNIPVQQNKDIDNAVITLLTYAPTQPLSTNFDDGDQSFRLVFDAIVSGNTTLWETLYDLIMSELGYMYLANGETLVIENETARDGFPTLSTYSYGTGSPTGGALKKMDGGYLRLMSGGKILLSAEEIRNVSSTLPRLTEIERVDGRDVLNKIVVTVQPRMVNFGVGEIYQLATYNLYSDDPPIPVPAGETIVIEGVYPESSNNKIPDAAIDVITPTYPTYFSFSTGPAGAADLVINFIGGGDTWSWEITNNGAYGEIGFFEIFGRPIYRKQPLSYTAEDQASQTEYDIKSASYNLIYRRNISGATQRIKNLLQRRKDSKTIIKSVSFLANLDQNSMENFMLTDFGDFRKVVSSSLGVNQSVFIQGAKIKIAIGGLIYVTFQVKEWDPPMFSERFLTLRTNTPANQYFAVTWSPELGLFAACGDTGTLSRIMTSDDGINWTVRTSATGQFYSICWSPELGLFVAVGDSNLVLVSSDGISWSSYTPAANNHWRGVCWSPELGMFVAVAETGTGNRVMTSTDGMNWTIRTSTEDNAWRGVCWSPELNLFVAVAQNGTNRVMTSPDGIIWSPVLVPARVWSGVCWSSKQNKFVAIAPSYSMTSSNGSSWVESNHANSQSWHHIAYSPYLDAFMVVADDIIASTRVMYSYDGSTWATILNSAVVGGDVTDHQWYGICWSPALSIFAIVGYQGTGKVMTF